VFGPNIITTRTRESIHPTRTHVAHGHLDSKLDAYAHRTRVPLPAPAEPAQFSSQVAVGGVNGCVRMGDVVERHVNRLANSTDVAALRNVQKLSEV
jgi:hypothetical protein